MTTFRPEKNDDQQAFHGNAMDTSSLVVNGETNR